MRSHGESNGGANGRRPSDRIPMHVRDALRRRLMLSPREFQVSLLVVDGFPDKLIARELKCSQHTVDTHLRRIFRKLGIGSRQRLVTRVFVVLLECLEKGA